MRWATAPFIRTHTAHTQEYALCQKGEIVREREREKERGEREREERERREGFFSDPG